MSLTWAAQYERGRLANDGYGLGKESGRAEMKAEIVAVLQKTMETCNFRYWWGLNRACREIEEM